MLRTKPCSKDDLKAQDLSLEDVTETGLFHTDAAMKLVSRVLRFFKDVDSDSSGAISPNELLSFVHNKILNDWKHGPERENHFNPNDLPENLGSVVLEGMKTWDKNGNGELNFSEFAHFVIHSNLFLPPDLWSQTQVHAEVLAAVDSLSVVNGRLTVIQNCQRRFSQRQLCFGRRNSFLSGQPGRRQSLKMDSVIQVGQEYFS